MAHDAQPTAAKDDELVGPDWEWRHRIRNHPLWGRPYRIAVLIVGWLVVLVGLVTVPLPGQGWLTVLLGVAILATEYRWASRLLKRGKAWLQAWSEWIGRQSWVVRGVVGLATFAVVAGALWLVLRATGVPSYLPDAAENWLKLNAGLS